eukprot:scaffold4188_cov73-Phaeocystis_antarctica.AAC.2
MCGVCLNWRVESTLKLEPCRAASTQYAHGGRCSREPLSLNSQFTDHSTTGLHTLRAAGLPPGLRLLPLQRAAAGAARVCGGGACLARSTSSAPASRCRTSSSSASMTSGILSRARQKPVGWASFCRTRSVSERSVRPSRCTHRSISTFSPAGASGGGRSRTCRLLLSAGGGKPSAAQQEASSTAAGSMYSGRHGQAGAGREPRRRSSASAHGAASSAWSSDACLRTRGAAPPRHSSGGNRSSVSACNGSSCPTPCRATASRSRVSSAAPPRHAPGRSRRGGAQKGACGAAACIAQRSSCRLTSRCNQCQPRGRPRCPPAVDEEKRVVVVAAVLAAAAAARAAAAAAAA